MSDDTGKRLLDPLRDWAEMTQRERLLRLTTPLGKDRLLAHRFHGHERLGRIPAWRVDTISLDADIDPQALIGKPVTLAIRLEDGSETCRHGLVESLTYLGADGGLHDWQLVFVPWFALLAYREDCRIWMDRSIIDVLTDVFSHYPEAAGRYRFDLRRDYPALSYVVQINEPDSNFVQRWLEQEGLYWYTLHEPDRHTIVFTDDVDTLPASEPTAIRFHTQAATQHEDSVLQWRPNHTLHSQRTHYVSRDYRAHTRPLEAGVPTTPDATTLDGLERYAWRGQYAWNTTGDGARLLRGRMEAQESAARRIHAVSGVRRLKAGEWFELRDHPLVERRGENARQFIVIDVELFAESNLPIAFERRDRPGSLGPLIRAFRDRVMDAPAEAADERERSRTYGFFLNRLECQRRDLPYRSPEQHRRPEVGIQTAVVVTPPGHEVYTDRLNRIHVRFNWDRLASDERLSSCWLRVMHNSSGPDWGTVNVPRAGEEVLVGFMDNHVDRPVVLGQLYGGHYPQWHSTGLMSGLRSKEIGGRGHNQLVMDDATGQLRTQLASSESTTELNLGYLIDQQGNTRGARRGTGFELRTDAYGAIRARNGLYLSSWGRPGGTGSQLDAGEAWRQLREGHELSRTLSQTAKRHRAEALGGVEPLERFNRNSEHTYGNATTIDGTGARRFADGGGDTDHAIRNGGQGEVPGLEDALILMAAPDGIATATPESTHLHSGEHLTVSTGEDVNIAAGRSLLASIADRLSLFVHRAGMKLIAAGGRVDIQAQDDEMELQSRRAMRLSSTDDAVILAGKKEILLTSGDAYIRLADGNIEIHAPKAVNVKGAKKQFGGPVSMTHRFNQFPESSFSETYQAVDTDGTPIAHRYFELRQGKEIITTGITDAEGYTGIRKSEFIDGMSIRLRRGQG
ncbi:hypothetical protein KBTX_01148 [wastewater metagenome]|uniref:Actin cross-linking toxin VgrG1 n=2 Tax=unclassified sequences TaxID=12908 RepID=A0A5B8R710_9ZZZZ|nr:type VI secretion system Vgr family protein [Arhodomonas sp. KWT]QEA04839.1 hypothetical protein KBTEX_01148 [uncultured organism]